MNQTKEEPNSQVLEAVSEIKRFIERYEREDLAPKETASGTLVAGLRNDAADDPWYGDVPDANWPDMNEGVPSLPAKPHATTK